MKDGDRLRVVAHLPGRLRVRAETFRVLPEVAGRVVAKLEGEPGVSSCESSAITGSLLVLYDPRQAQLLRLIRTILIESDLVGVEVDDRDIELGLPPGIVMRRAAARVDDHVRRFTRDKIDLRVGVPGALAALGIGTLLAGRTLMPAWYDFVFWSFVTFSNLNPPSARSASSNPRERDPGPEEER